jgi:hypothetical protein
MVAERLSERVAVVITAPGASSNMGITMLKPLPLRGGPSRTIESSTEDQHSTPREVPNE